MGDPSSLIFHQNLALFFKERVKSRLDPFITSPFIHRTKIVEIGRWTFSTGSEEGVTLPDNVCKVKFQLSHMKIISI